MFEIIIFFVLAWLVAIVFALAFVAGGTKKIWPTMPSKPADLTDPAPK